MKTKIISLLLAISVLLSIGIFDGFLPEANAATVATIKATDLVNYLSNRVGTNYPAGYCLAFVADVFRDFGATRSSACCAYAYGSQYITSTSMNNIPIGADVFWTERSTFCDTCKNYCGHIGIYIGNGYVVHAVGGKVKKDLVTTINGWSTAGFRGWGYHGNIIIQNNSTPDNHEVWKVSTDDGLNLNLRSGAGISHSVLIGIPDKTTINVTAKAGADGYIWGKTSYNGKEGWVALDYCTYVSGSIGSAGYKVSYNLNGGVMTPAIKDSFTANGINIGRAADTLVVFTDSYGTTTGTNHWGMEVVVNSSGLVISKTEYLTPGNSTIPEGGFVLSGIGSGLQLINEIQLNEYVSYNPNTLLVKVYPNQESCVIDAKTVVNGKKYGLLPTPTRNGFVFNGWSLSNGTKITEASTVNASGNITLTAQWTAVTLSSITVKTNPTKTSYNVGNTLNTAGLTLTATYSDNTTQTVSSGFTCTPTVLNTAGTQKITVTYQGKTATFNVAVTDNTASAKYTVSSAKAAPGGTVVLTVSVANNPGIISLRNTVSFDGTALELIKVENLALLNGYTTPSPTMTSPYTLRWADSFATANNTKNGALVKLTFKVKDTAPKGSYTVTAVNTEARNVNGDTVAFATGSGTVTVTNVISGDADGDGEVTDWDAILLNRYLAGWNVTINEAACDVSGNDGINDWDAIVLERYLAGWSVTLG